MRRGTQKAAQLNCNIDALVKLFATIIADLLFFLLSHLLIITIIFFLLLLKLEYYMYVAILFCFNSFDECLVHVIII